MSDPNGYPLYAERSREYAEPAGALWARILDYKNHPVGASDVTEVRDVAEGVWIETQPTVVTRVEIESQAPAERLVRRLTGEDGMIGGVETLSLLSTPTGCRVTVARDLRVKRGAKGWMMQKMARAFAAVGTGVAEYLETLDPPEDGASS